MMMYRGQTLWIFDLLDWIVSIFRLEASWVAEFAAKTISTFVFEEYSSTISQLSKKSNSKNKFYVCNSLENNFMMSNGNDFSSPCFGLVCLDGGEHESASDTELRKIQHVMMEASWKNKMYSQYNCFIPFKLRSNPSHLSQWLCCNILIFSSGSIWINVSKYKYQTRI